MLNGIQAPVTSIAGLLAQMQSVDLALPPADGLACFNRMYRSITQTVEAQIGVDFFAGPAWMTHLDVVFGNLYLSAASASEGQPGSVPRAWAALLEQRSNPRVTPLQFALAGMNAHINHDLPVAVVLACGDLSTAPGDGSHHDDYQRVDGLLDAAEQAMRQSFESASELAVDRHVEAVATLVSNWSMNTARDVAWDEALALWEIRDHPTATALLTAALARTVAMVSRALLIAV
jgi:hypothetical protein